MNESHNRLIISDKHTAEVSHRAPDNITILEDGKTRSTTEDDSGLQCTPPKDNTEIVPDTVEREPVFVMVDSSCVCNPSAKEIIDSKTNPKDTILNKYYNQKVLLADLPSTSKDHANTVLPPQLMESESIDEMQMLDINLQSDNDLAHGAGIENEAVVVSFIKNKDAFKEAEGTLLSTKKKSSILDSVPKMETILEGEQFTRKTHIYLVCTELSETSLDVHIPSFPGSPRTLYGSPVSLSESNIDVRAITDYLHYDNDFLVAAEIGDVNLLEIIIRKGTNIQELDQWGRNALHLAICSGNELAIMLLLTAGVHTNVIDNVGTTPLSLCLLRSPSLSVAKLLFQHGAKIAPRRVPMDTGLFLQVVMMCFPTSEEEKILCLLVEKGALINDPEAPGGRQALHFAAMSNNCKLIEILIGLGADLFAKNHRNQTPKEVALTFKCFQAYSLLEELERCNSNNTSDTIGDTADTAAADASPPVARIQ